MDSIYGSYKISTKLLYRMISNSASDDGGYVSLSRYELLAMIHLTHIADASGRVEHFRTSEFISAINCSRREAFALIHALSDKGYIEVSDSDWKCCRSIKIRDNDFSRYDKSMRYLNTNHDFFIRAGLYHKEFTELSATSMKLLLYLMYNYSQNYGYHASYSSVQDAMGIKSRRVIARCLDEISPLLKTDGTFYTVREDMRRGLRYGYIDILSGIRNFLPNTGISKDQDSYFKRHIENMVTGEGYAFSGYKEDKPTLLSRIFGLFSLYDKAPLDELCGIFKKRLVLDGRIDELTLYHLSSDFSLATAG